MEFNDFVSEIQKKRQKGPFKIRNSFGTYDCYKLMRKNKWYNIGRPLKEHEFYTIVRGVNDLLAEEIANGNTVAFPERMGKLELRKHKRGVSIVNGKMKVTYPIDWGETMKLWFEDEEAKKKKTLLRRENSHVYHIRYCKYDANYENKIFYEFALNRFIKLALKDNINQGKIDALW